MVELVPKIQNLLQVVRERTRLGEFIILPHATSRREERNVSVADIIFVLKHGEHEADKDQFKHSFGSWNYSVRGQTVDARTLRIAVAFDKDDMLIVTVIPLGKKRKSWKKK